MNGVFTCHKHRIAFFNFIYLCNPNQTIRKATRPGYSFSFDLVLIEFPCFCSPWPAIISLRRCPPASSARFNDGVLHAPANIGNKLARPLVSLSSSNSDDHSVIDMPHCRRIELHMRINNTTLHI